MHRLTIVLLAAVDAVLASAGGLLMSTVVLAVLWVFGFGGGADWSALWPAAASVWQLGHGVPLAITLPSAYTAAAGIDAAASGFTLSIAPTAFAAFTMLFAARSGRRASRAGAATTGVVTGTAVFGAVALGVALSSESSVAATETWLAMALPTALFVVPGAIGAFVTEWIEADLGPVARLRDRIESAEHGWGLVPALAARGSAIALVALAGVSAAVLALAVVLGAGTIVALFQTAHVDALGATMLTIAQLAFLPTLMIWSVAFVAGPGFALGASTLVSSAGAQSGIVPGIPILGAVPEHVSSWLLLLALLPVAVGAFAGWVVRSRLCAQMPKGTQRLPVRGVLVAAIAVPAGAIIAVLSLFASGSAGPGALARVGPDPLLTGVAVALEVALGAAIVLLSPRRSAPSQVGLVPAGADEVGRNRPGHGVDEARVADDEGSFQGAGTDTEPIGAADTGDGWSGRHQ